MQSKGVGSISQSWMVMLCLASFVLGMFFTNKIWIGRIDAHHLSSLKNTESLIKEELRDNKEPCEDNKEGSSTLSKDILGEVSRTHDAIRTLDSTISMLEMELAASRSHSKTNLHTDQVTKRSDEAVKAFLVIGVNTGFSSRKRRDAVRETWMPHGDKLRELEEKKGIVVRFIIGHSATPGSILDRAIDAENNHIEGYHELPAKIKTFFSTAVAMWDADFYIKVDDDVHVNLGMLGSALAKHKAKARVYIGCMKTGPVLSQKGMKYHEPEYWRFGEEGNKYFQHAAGQIYALSKDLATYISINGAILHKYANEDVSMGSWLIGLDVEHIDDRSLCCGTPPDCELKAQAGTGCIASFDWACSGICRSAARLKSVHQQCGEGEEALRHLPDFRMLRHEKFSFDV